MGGSPDLLGLPSLVPRKAGSYRWPIGNPFRHLPRRASSNCRVAPKAAPCLAEIAARRGKMSGQRWEAAAPVEPYFDRTPQPFGDGPADPLVYDASPRALRQRTVSFAA